MTPISEQWEWARRLFDEARSLPADRRASFLERACRDPELRAEVSVLLRAHADLESRANVGFLDPIDPERASALLTFTGEERAFGERSAVDPEPGVPDGDTPTSGRAPVLFAWGQLDVLGKLGEGGFGEVYRAYDPMLDREVALKLRKAGPSRERDGGRAWLREAQRLARVRHPHVVSVQGAGEHDGRVGFWADLIDGQTLADIVRVQGPQSAEEAGSVGRVLCSALAAVHGAGFVHGDVKPSNVMRERGGRIVLMDLGAASLLCRGAEDQRTIRLQGTPVTMAPELLEGAAPTAASDIYSVGVLLYFLVTGVYPARAPSYREVLARHRDGELVPLRDERSDLPAPFLAVVERALAREPAARYASAGAMERALGRAMGDRPVEDASVNEGGLAASTGQIRRAPGGESQALEAGGFGAPRRRVRQNLGWAVAAALAVALSLVARVGPRNDTAPASPIWTSIQPPDGVTALGIPALSPDGRALAFGASGLDGPGELWLRNLGAGGARALPGTEDASFPFFSPDGRSVGFFAGGSLKIMDLASGRIQTLVDSIRSRATAAWAGEGPGVILFHAGQGTGGLRRIAGSGGRVVEVTALDASRGDAEHLWPHFLPDGRHFVFMVQAGPESGIYLGSLDRGEIERLFEIPFPAGSGAAYSESGHLVYLVEGTLLARPFDATRLRLTGEPVPIVQGVWQLGPGLAAFSVSREGTLVFQADPGLDIQQPVWLDREGQELEPAGPPGPYYTPAFELPLNVSPDGRWLAVTRRQPARLYEVWILDLGRGTASPFATGRIDAAPVWSPDADRVAWSRGTDLPPQVYVKPLASDGEAERLTTGTPAVLRLPTDWSTSGRYIFYDQDSTGPTGYDIYVLDLESEGRPSRPYLATTASERHAVLSPGEHLVAYVSNVSGVHEVYLSTFPEHGPRWQVSQGGGALPLWSPDGKQVLYRGPGGRVMAVRIDDGPGEIVLSEPELLFHREEAGFPTLAPDGERFLGLRKVEDAPLKPYTLILNWPPQP
jgi:eukaryotic-like serine/threonine-protein kinase